LDVGRGVITIAVGERRYVDMAVTLGRSLRRHSPGLALAVVSDSDDEHLHEIYDIHVPPDPAGRRGFHDKLRLDQYSPFRETLFIDSDCLVVDAVEPVFDLFAGRDFGVVGNAIRGGDWYMDVRRVLEKIDRDQMPKFNGGIYWFRDGPQAGALFETARGLSPRYAEFGMRSFRGTISEEPIYAVALALHRVAPLDDEGRAMSTPLSMRGWLHIDVLRGEARWRKGRRVVRPRIAHFAGPYASARDPRSAFYRRERRKLELAHRGARRAGLRATLEYGPLCLAGFLAINVWEAALAGVARLERIRKR
jgi:hypothetical protein